MKPKLINLFAYLLLAASIAFNLWLNFPETRILSDPNDNIFQYSLVYRTNWVWENYGCPFSLSCLPNLIDHNVSAWAEGYPLPFYYSHVPQVAIVASYKLFISPILNPLFTQFLNYPITLYVYYNWTKYLLLTLFPIPVFLALRITGLSPFVAALGAFFSSQFSTDGLYGIDSPSYLWRGYGLTSQLYALFFLPLGLAFTYRAVRDNSKLKIQKSKLQVKSQNLISDKDTSDGVLSLSKDSSEVEESVSKKFVSEALPGRGKNSRNNLLWAVVFLTLTTAGHLGIGIIGYLSTLPFLLMDFKFNYLVSRFKKLFLILTSSFLILSYWIIPILLNNNYHIISFWDPIWKFDSYGWHEVIRQFWQGEIFDWQRTFPLITALVIIGFFVMLADLNLIPFAFLFAFWFLMYFGRTSWGGLLDLIPGMKDFHQSRFIVGVHVAGIFLIPAVIEFVFRVFRKITEIPYIINSKVKSLIQRLISLWLKKSKLHLKTQNLSSFAKHVIILEDRIRNLVSAFGNDKRGNDTVHQSKTTHDRILRHCGQENYYCEQSSSNLLQNIIFYILSLTFISIITYFTAQQTIKYASFNNRWIGESNNAYKYDEKNFQDLVFNLKTKPNARVYAGRPGNWGHDFRLGSTQMYMLLGVNGFDISQFLPETWSPMSENEQNFDERVAEDYDLLNIRNIVSDKNHDFTPKARLDKKYGPFELYEVPTTGWFDIVSSPMIVSSDKTNFINAVHLWHRSFARRWKMHPLISVEKKPYIPDGLGKVIQMTDEVNYKDINPQSVINHQLPAINNRQSASKNIFTDHPFIFPEATNSGRITKENVVKQTYSATVEIPQNCPNCMVMFKMSYHPDWEMKVDGHKTLKYSIFPFYMAVPASPGTHTVEFEYKPNKLKTILLGGEIILIILFLLKLRASR